MRFAVPDIYRSFLAKVFNYNVMAFKYIGQLAEGGHRSSKSWPGPEVKAKMGTVSSHTALDSQCIFWQTIDEGSAVKPALII